MPEKTNSIIRNRPIGIFDSGFGGLTVMSAINKILPNESIIYFGDTAHVPYGSKSRNTVLKFSKDISSFLVKNNIKMLVIACNTASAFALSTLKKELTVPVTGVIEPGAKAAIEATKNNKIGIIGTEGTISSNAYLKAIKKISPKADIYQQACPLFVPLVEEGWNEGKVTDEIVKYYLKSLLSKKVDTIVLGCTHYPLLMKTLRKNTGKQITLIDSANATAFEVQKILKNNGLLADNKKKNKFSFYVSDNPKKFQKIGSMFFSKKIKSVKKIYLE